MAADHAVLPVNRDAGEIADMLVGTGELVEQGSFAAVLVSGQRKGQWLALGDGVPLFMVMIAGRVVQFAAAGVRRGRMAVLDRGGAVCFVNAFYLNLAGVIQPQGQFIAAQFQFNGVSHRGNFAQRHLGAGRQPHIQQMAAQRAAAANRLDHGVLPDVEFCQCHIFLPSSWRSPSPPWGDFVFA